MEEAGLLGECKRWPVQVRTDPITDHYAVEARPFARGKFASVRRCRHLSSGREFAAKYMRKRRRAQDVRHEIMHEARVLTLAADHPHIVRMHEVYETPSEIVLVLELVPGGELQRVLDDEEAVSEAEAARLLRQILDGVAFLHRHRIAHLDLKPQNLLLSAPFPAGGGEVKLCDFGISRLITKGVEIREIVGTPDYVAPEVLHYEPISLPTDMWSLGVLTYVLLCGHSPFGGDTKQETFCNITRGSLDFPPDLFAATSPHAKHFIRGLLIREPRERMTAEECLSHPWLNPGGSPLPGICLNLSPEGATGDTPPSSPSRRRNTSCSESPSSPKTTRTGLLCGSDQVTSPNNSPSVQSNGTSSDCKTTTREEDSRVICTSDRRDSWPGVSQNVSSQKSPSPQCNGKTTRAEDLLCKNAPDQETSPDVQHKSPLLQRNSYCKTARREEDCNNEKDHGFFCKSEQRAQNHEPSPHKSPLMQRNGTSSCSSVGAFCKTTRTEELFCKSATEPSHTVHHPKNPLLQRSAAGVGAFSTTEEDNENDSRLPRKGDQRDPSPSVAQSVSRKSPLLQRNGAFCKLGDAVTQSSSFCQSSVLQRHSESSKTTASFSKNSSSVVDQGVMKESKSRSVDMVVSQFEGMSKRIVFSEEIIVDERVGMVY